MTSSIYEYYLRLLTNLTNEEIYIIKSQIDTNYILYHYQYFISVTQDKMSSNSLLSQYSQLKYIFDNALTEVLKLKLIINDFFVSN